jgi:hypothetical protein
MHQIVCVILHCFVVSLVIYIKLTARQLDIDGGIPSRLSGNVFVLETFAFVPPEKWSFLWVPLSFSIEPLE